MVVLYQIIKNNQLLYLIIQKQNNFVILHIRAVTDIHHLDCEFPRLVPSCRVCRFLGPSLSFHVFFFCSNFRSKLCFLSTIRVIVHMCTCLILSTLPRLTAKKTFFESFTIDCFLFVKVPFNSTIIILHGLLNIKNHC